MVKRPVCLKLRSNMNNNKKWRIAAVAAITLLLLAGVIAIVINNNKNDAKASVSVVASYYPLYDFAKNIGGDKVQATNITPAGSEPHDFEPTPQQLVETNKSDVFIFNGGTMEPWVDKFIPDYKNTAVNASSGIALLEGKADQHESGAEEPGHTETPTNDPHFWLDPILAEQIVDNVKNGLIKASPNDSAYFTDRANDYKAKLAQLDNDYKNGLASCQSRTIVTSHGAFSYLGKRYNLDVVSIAGLSPEEEPSAAKMAELSQLVKDKGIKYVFFESLVSPKLAETVANEAGAKTAVFDPIEGISDEDQKQGKDYISVQKENLQNLRTALSCQ